MSKLIDPGMKLSSVLLVFVLFMTGVDAQEMEPQEINTEMSEANVPRFYVGEYRVEGNTILDELEVELALTPFLGEDKTIQDVESARSTLQSRYRDKGFPTVFVDIPEQDVDQGVVYLSVTEGKVDSMSVVGSRYFSLERIRAQVPALAEGAVPYLPEVQAQISSVNSRSGDRRITPVLRPGKTPGSLEVELRVKDTMPLHGFLELNNRYTRDTEKARLVAGLSYDNLWQKEHSLSLQYQTAPQNTDELGVLSGTYLWKSADSDKLVAIYAVSSESNTASVGSLNVIGNGDIVGIRRIVPLAPSDDYYHSFSYGVDYKNFDESVGLLGADQTNTSIGYVHAAFQYNSTMRKDTAIYKYSAGVNMGIKAFNNDTELCFIDTNDNPVFANVFECKRFKAKPNYAYLTGGITAQYNVWKDAVFEFKVDGQLADSPLISNQQYSAGGASSVRGYYESQALGDNVLLLKVSLKSANLSQPLPDSVSSAVDNLQLQIFSDWAKLQTLDPLPSQERAALIYSAGMGIRVAAWKSLNLDCDWAYPMKDNGSVVKGDDRLHARIELKF